MFVPEYLEHVLEQHGIMHRLKAQHF